MHDEEDRKEAKTPGARMADMMQGWTVRDDRVLALVKACDTSSREEAGATITSRAEKFYEFLSFGTPGEAHLGLATTQELLDELTTRIQIDGYNGGGGLSYRTVDG